MEQFAGAWIIYHILRISNELKCWNSALLLTEVSDSDVPSILTKSVSKEAQNSNIVPSIISSNGYYKL